MPTAPTPAIASAATNAAASPSPELQPSGNQRAQHVAACLGICCPKRGRCVHYSEVERPEQPRAVRSCRTPEGTFPLFEAIEPRRRTDASPVDGEGSEVD